MSSLERRVSPRKECFVPVRFRVVNGRTPSEPSVRLTNSSQGPAAHARFGMLEGEAVNLSERGFYFVCRDEVMEGQRNVEIFFTIPTELTGRAHESIRCRARIVHAQQLEGKRNTTGPGAVVGYLEPLARARPRAS